MMMMMMNDSGGSVDLVEEQPFCALSSVTIASLTVLS
jgi:hypothetical protein